MDIHFRLKASSKSSAMTTRAEALASFTFFGCFTTRKSACRPSRRSQAERKTNRAQFARSSDHRRRFDPVEINEHAVGVTLLRLKASADVGKKERKVAVGLSVAAMWPHIHLGDLSWPRPGDIMRTIRSCMTST